MRSGKNHLIILIVGKIQNEIYIYSLLIFILNSYLKLWLFQLYKV